jgi:CheY-like chemotaxis protein
MFRILCVDDEADVCEILEISLALDPAFSVRSCESGAEAIALAADWCPDMILCDVMMPQMDGPTTLARLRESPSTADIPVVFVTARTQPAELERFKSLGVADIITKPFDPMTLPGRVRSYLRAPALRAV